ncbi:MAG: flagellar assembly protein FliH [Sulfurospirillaceae bacterium]|nr:flagellar assembly protein FliH [Sulfurospirillaceae bacterium]
MENIILQDDISNHSIQKYRFKVLGSYAKDEQQNQYDVIDNKDLHEEVIQPPKKVDETQSKFIEELLKRSDELSSNIVKLQMQIEKQEEEFERRLKEDLAREKDISYNEGYEKAKLDLEENFDSLTLKYNNSNQRLNEKIIEIDNSFKKLEHDLSTSAVEIAKEVIKKEISNSSSDIAVALSKNLLQEIKDANKITLKINPYDFMTLDEIYKNNDKIKVEADDAISKGGVILLSENGNLDGTISARLEKVKYLLENS